MLTEKGFQRPSFEEILTVRIARAKQLLGDDVDTSEQSVLGKFIRLGAFDMAQAYEALEGAYLARFPNSAAGQSLDRLMPFAGIQRNPASAAVHEVEITGTPGYEVPVGFLVASASGTMFHTMVSVVLDDAGKATAQIECNESGKSGNMSGITEIVNPDADIVSVRYIQMVSAGTETESDYELRQRFQKTVAGAGSATADAISAEVMRVQGVQGCLIAENDGDTTDAAGRPPHSFECFVLAPESVDYEVASAIFEKKPLGIKCVGTVDVQVKDSGGLPHTVRFSRTREITIYIKATIKTNTLFENTGAEQITDDLIEHIGGLKNGEDVILSSLYGIIHRTTGVVETSMLELSTDGTVWNSGNVVVGVNEVARLKAANVVIEVTEYVDQ